MRMCKESFKMTMVRLFCPLGGPQKWNKWNRKWNTPNVIREGVRCGERS